MSEMACESIHSDIGGLCTFFRNVLLDMGFDECAIQFAERGECRVETVTDSFNSEERISGSWLNAEGTRFAHFIRYANGTLFAEHDVLLGHPQKPEMFVEALEVWGQPGSFKHDVKLLPAL